MKPNFYIFLFTSFVIGSLTSATAFASEDSLMCSDGIVSLGDVASDLIKKCGQPTYTSQHEQKIVSGDESTGDRVITTIIIDDWTFNFGPGRFQYRILLKNGRVCQIESLGYGY